ncbi:alpha/beta fold hydrolase [Oharaeibacter diazotrophicus]|uniref:Pimeloyl-ACP methyl ester carboxylesterase n=1 Tax=Oharaeibacter diazotrophicus TaxID=1920512 RepID=A0A4R6RLE7_9HYPH|nr:alpha/beta fold hydrolase [Oharaeibacter diazotrophicus]TDP87481.1 pimeloyl-ACP methyl ester carboxylesterase [Oharaeibacter diazotrophicus]BBE70575.1 putative non-heme bromoperoxidase BpoC [Pleomorphomonas sp. SM30]GLS77321.1 alpha/beta hydrolase [Oharaeibacter diazotrophicus]
MTLPIVLVPGLNCTATLFADQIEALSTERGVMVACHGRQDRVADVAAAVLADAPERFVLGGLSMGGYVAFEILRQAPERVAGLILMDTTARPDAPDAVERRERQIALAEGGRFADIPTMQIPLLVAEGAVERLGPVVRAMAEATGPEAFVRQQRAILSRPDSRPDLAAIAVPTLVVVGDRDRITPPEHAEEIADAIGASRLAVMPVCGHLATLERPEAVTHAIRGFLADAGL